MIPYNRTWVIAFLDSEEEFFREEIYKDNEFINYGNVLTFESRKEAEKFILENTDSSAYDFYSKIIDSEELNKYENKYKDE